MTETLDRVPAMRLLSLKLSCVGPYMKRIDHNSSNSTFAPIYCESQEGLALFLGTTSSSVALFANGTLALQAAIESVGIASDKWALRSWITIAVTQDVVCEPRSRTLVAGESRARVVRPKVVSWFPDCLITASLGSRLDVSETSNAYRPTLIKATYCIDACSGIRAATQTLTVLIVSLLAMKTLSAEEGAPLVGHKAWVAEAVQSSNFGSGGPQKTTSARAKTKISQFHYAMELASSDGRDKWRSHWERVRERDVRLVQRQGPEAQSHLASGFIAKTIRIGCPPSYLAGMAPEELSRKKCKAGRWWPDGVAEIPALAPTSHFLLPAAQVLADCPFGLSCFRDLSDLGFIHIEEISQSISASPGV